DARLVLVFGVVLFGRPVGIGAHVQADLWAGGGRVLVISHVVCLLGLIVFRLRSSRRTTRRRRGSPRPGGRRGAAVPPPRRSLAGRRAGRGSHARSCGAGANPCRTCGSSPPGSGATPGPFAHASAWLGRHRRAPAHWP